MSKLAYKAPEPGGGARVPDGLGVLRTTEGDDDEGEAERIVDVLVWGGVDGTSNVVVVVPDGLVTVVGGPGLRRLGEYMRLFSRKDRTCDGNGDGRKDGGGARGDDIIGVNYEGTSERTLSSNDGTCSDEEEEGAPRRHDGRGGGDGGGSGGEGQWGEDMKKKPRQGRRDETCQIDLDR